MALFSSEDLCTPAVGFSNCTFNSAISFGYTGDRGAEVAAAFNQILKFDLIAAETGMSNKISALTDVKTNDAPLNFKAGGHGASTGGRGNA